MAEKAADGSSASTSAGPSKLPMILVLVNSVALLAAAGTAVYTKMVYQRPSITEDGERARLTQAAKDQQKSGGTLKSETLAFESMTVNIATSSAESNDPSVEPTPQGGKLHYLTVAMSVEIFDSSRKAEFEKLRPFIMDKMLSLLGRKKFHELNSLQGRYLLRTELLEAINSLDPKRKDGTASGPMATEIYFTQFIVQ